MAIAKRKARKITVRTVPDNPDSLGVCVQLQFDPREIGPERTKTIYRSFAEIALAFLEPEEIPEFLKKINAAGKAAAKRIAKGAKP